MNDVCNTNYIQNFRIKQFGEVNKEFECEDTRKNSKKKRKAITLRYSI